MLKHLFTVALIAAFHSTFAQQATDWSTYYENDQVRISIKNSDCDYPEKGVHNRYLFLKLENLTTNTVAVSYNLNRSYNGKELSADKSNFEFNVNAQSAISAKCADLKDGLHLFSSMLNVEATSKLSGFELANLMINGKNVAQ